jgi:pimeloyl-ACP methyl ester carboxylesterase
VDVGGTSAHVLRADASVDSPPDAPTQLLLHPMTSGATMWLDVINPLTVLGPVIASDLPGAVLGETEAPISRAGKAAPSARFVRALTSALGLDRVVAHGWSMGGLVALLFAANSPTRVSNLILAGAPLPVPMTTPDALAGEPWAGPAWRQELHCRESPSRSAARKRLR